MTGFHVPVMEFPLRNTKEVIKLAGLDSNNAKKTANVAGAKSYPSYSLPPHLMTGVQCQQIKVKKNDDAELSKAVEAGCRVMTQRTAGSGFPVLLESSVFWLFKRVNFFDNPYHYLVRSMVCIMLTS